MADEHRALAPLARDEKVVLGVEPQHAELVYERTAPVESHLAELGELFLHDKRVERKRRILHIVMWVVGVPGFLFFTPSFGLSMLPLLGFWLWRRKLASGDLEDRRLHAARFVLETLAPELKPRPLAVRVDFGGYHKAPPRLDASRGSGGPSYERKWLSLQLPLLDGSAVSVEASTRLKRKERRKRKYTKVKERLVDELDIELRRPRGAPVTVSVDELRQRFSGQHALLLTGCRVTERGASLSFRTPTALRQRLRPGWSGKNLEALLDGRKVLAAIIASHAAVTAPARDTVAA